MSNYPEWVLTHKKKGTYINFQNGKYYLYAAHSERIPGTDKVKRVSDGYLGRITEKDGFIPAKRKLPDKVYAYEYGLSVTILSLCGKVHSGLRREFRTNADFVMVSGALLYKHGEIKQEFYESSWLSVLFPGFDMRKTLTGKQRTGIERARRMIADTLGCHFGEGCNTAVSFLALVFAIRTGNETVICIPPEGATEFLHRYGIYFEEVSNG